MLYRKLGKTDEQVSILGFGCMRLPIIGEDPTKIDEDKAIKMIHYAIDNGVNYIDTAYPYHGSGMDRGGESEPFVAKALKNGYREKVRLATKLPSWLIKTREDMDKYLNEQLERLNTDTIDFYLVHCLNSSNWYTLKEAGIDEFLDQAIKDGRIKYAGFSFHDRLELFKEIIDYYEWTFCQIQYNYLDENFQAGKEGLEYAADKGLGIIIMEPLRGGEIVNRLPEKVKEMFENAQVKRSPAQWALRWVWNHPQVSVVLSGMTIMEQVVENIMAAKEGKADSLTEDELGIVNQVKTIFKEKIKVNCTDCGYCMPCPSGVNIPKNFSLYNEYHVFDSANAKERSKFRYNFIFKKEEQAEKCVACGKCEKHCPQNIPISKHLAKVREIFG